MVSCVALRCAVSRSRSGRRRGASGGQGARPAVPAALHHLQSGAPLPSHMCGPCQLPPQLSNRMGRPRTLVGCARLDVRGLHTCERHVRRRLAFGEPLKRDQLTRTGPSRSLCTDAVQAVVFLNAAEVAEGLTDRLIAEGYPSAFVSGAQAQVNHCQATTIWTPISAGTVGYH